MGIDPGASGGIAVVTPDYAFAMNVDPNEHKTWERCRFMAAIAPGGILFAVIEDVHSMPGQGVSSSFKFGRSYGFLRACLVASGIPFEAVSPSKWQGAMNCRKQKGATKTQHKNALKAYAQRLFPDVNITLATADALLLAEYARRLWVERRGP